jgi:hypothetical protein
VVGGGITSSAERSGREATDEEELLRAANVAE